MVYALLTFTILVLLTGIDGIDRNLYRASSSLGANSSQSFWRIVVPLSTPGVTASAFIVSVMSLGFYVTPRLAWQTKGHQCPHAR